MCVSNYISQGSAAKGHSSGVAVCGMIVCVHH